MPAEVRSVPDPSQRTGNSHSWGRQGSNYVLLPPRVCLSSKLESGIEAGFKPRHPNTGCECPKQHLYQKLAPTEVILNQDTERIAIKTSHLHTIHVNWFSLLEQQHARTRKKKILHLTDFIHGKINTARMKEFSSVFFGIVVRAKNIRSLKEGSDYTHKYLLVGKNGTFCEK